MLRRPLTIVLLGSTMTAILALLAVGSAFAHHGFATEFDAKGCMDLKGTLTGVNWQNPHGYVLMDVKDANGKVESWSLETISPNSMKRAGTTREDFASNTGKPVAARACPTKPGGTLYRGTVEILVLADGVPRILGQNIEGMTPEQVQQILPNLMKSVQ
jgi:hypothetical protein